LEVCELCLDVLEERNDKQRRRKYEAPLLGLKGAKSLGIEHLTVFGDSQLIVNQSEWQNKVSNVA
jgi:ribonuclease HI